MVLRALCAFLTVNITGVGIVHAATIYASAGGTGDGSAAAAASGDLCRALSLAKEGDSVWLSEGTFLVAAPCSVQKRRVQIVGGYKADFSARDAFAQPSRVSGSKGLMRVLPGGDDLVIDGVVFDGASDEPVTGYDPLKHLPLLTIEAGRVRLKSVVFVNGLGGAVEAKSSGTLFIDNVAAVSSRPFAFRFAGVCGYASPQCFDAVVKNATIVWTWRETSAEASSGGSAIVVGTGASVRVEKSVIAYSDHQGMSLDGDGPHQMAAQELVVFDNRHGDVGAAAVGAEGRMERLALPWDGDYLQRFLARASKPFYAGRLPWERAFMISPAPDAGLKPPAGSRFTYDMAVAGGPALAKAPDPKTEPVEEDDGKKGKKGKKKPKIGKKKGSK